MGYFSAGLKHILHLSEKFLLVDQICTLNRFSYPIQVTGDPRVNGWCVTVSTAR